jgi:hypothetical protein
MRRVTMLGAGGDSMGWTYDSEQYALVRNGVLDAVAALGDDDRGVLLKDIVAFTQERLGGHVRFPSGRLMNATRYVAADLQGRGLLERVGQGSPQRLRRVRAE